VRAYGELGIVEKRVPDVGAPVHGAPIRGSVPEPGPHTTEIMTESD
jgi:hypothetical protein